MTASANPFLVRTKIATEIQMPSENYWEFYVAENGMLQVDFLQTDKDLNVKIFLVGRGAKSEINCGYLLSNNNKININIQSIHQSPETSSSQVIKGLVTDSSKVSFNGTITIPYDSQKCDGHQNHRGVILSDKAEIVSIPQLEIWADDVKCDHGSAVGPLDEDQLFYLQTRGLSPSESRKLLLSSFFADLMPSDFDSNIQEWMDKHV